jgi:hypothetical protein
MAELVDATDLKVRFELFLGDLKNDCCQIQGISFCADPLLCCSGESRNPESNPKGEVQRLNGGYSNDLKN